MNENMTIVPIHSTTDGPSPFTLTLFDDMILSGEISSVDMVELDIVLFPFLTVCSNADHARIEHLLRSLLFLLSLA